MMGFNLQLGDALRSESVTAIDDAIREIVRQEIARTPRSKFCESCAYMHQPEISARCCCVACHGDDVPAWAQRMNVTTPLSSEKTGDASPASEVKACQGCGHAASDHPHHGPNGQVGKRTNYGDEWMCLADYCRCRLTRGEVEAHNYRRAPAPSPAPTRTVKCDNCGHPLSSAEPHSSGIIICRKCGADSEPAPSLAHWKSALDLKMHMHGGGCGIYFGRRCDCLTEKAATELASLRAEVERLRTALAEKERAGVDVALVEGLVASCERWARSGEDLIALHESNRLNSSGYSDAVKDFVPRLVALRTALGAKETK